MTEKMHLHIIDGTDAWIQVDVEQLSDNEFLIKDFVDFDPDDTSLIPRFIPGDIVTPNTRKTEKDEYWIADSLIKPSDHKDKKYIEFLYKTLTGDILKDDKERLKYKDAITRTAKEIKDGKFHYPAIVDYLKGVGTV